MVVVGSNLVVVLLQVGKRNCWNRTVVVSLPPRNEGQVYQFEIIFFFPEIIRASLRFAPKKDRESA